MTLKSKIGLGVFGWVVLISGLHAYLNVNWAAVLNDYRPLEKRKVTVAYLPVTCQLTCPVTDYISKFSLSGEMFLPRMFQGFPEMKEALISNRVQAAFIVAPMALALKAQGVPIKIVYLGHRYGSAVVVRKDGPVKTFADMRGRTIAIPSRFSDELNLSRSAGTSALTARRIGARERIALPASASVFGVPLAFSSKSSSRVRYDTANA